MKDCRTHSMNSQMTLVTEALYSTLDSCFQASALMGAPFAKGAKFWEGGNQNNGEDYDEFTPLCLCVRLELARSELWAPSKLDQTSPFKQKKKFVSIMTVHVKEMRG